MRRKRDKRGEREDPLGTSFLFSPVRWEKLAWTPRRL